MLASERASALVGDRWAERASAAALVPLTLWFVASIIAHAIGHSASSGCVRIAS